MNNLLTTTGESIALGDAGIARFRKQVRGCLISPGEEGYEQSRTVFNTLIDKKPGLIVRCTGAADVIASVNFARENGILLAVRGNGHSIAGKSLSDGGLMLDMSGLKGIRIDPVQRTARAQPGLRAGEYDREAQAFGLASTMGLFSTSGIAGLTLGGGLGWLMGKHGLACDNLLSADIVTADGRLLTADAENNADLFWAIRGGGGNFGIATSLEYRLYPVGPVFAGKVLYPLAMVKEVLYFFRDFVGHCPDELSAQTGTIITPDGELVVAISACYCGSPDMGRRLLDPVRKFGTPLADLFDVMPYVSLQGMLDEASPSGRYHYWKSNFLSGLSDEAIDTFAECSASTPSPYSAVWLEHLHGAASRIEPSATAFAHRKHEYNFSIFSQWTKPTDSGANIAWTRERWEAMRPYMADGVYVNYLEEEGDPRERMAYGQNYERLAALKQKYDPANLFRVNYNIKPEA